MDLGGPVGESGAARRDDVVEFVERGNMPIDDRLVDQGPQRLGGLKFRAVGRQEDKPDAVGHGKAWLAMPSGIVEHENDDPVASRAGLLGEEAQQRLKERLRHAVGHVPKALAGGRRHEGGDIEPFEAMMTVGGRPFADGRPDAADHRLEPDPVFVGREGLDRRIGAPRRLLGDDLGQFFLKASCSSAVADFGLRGRGF